MKAYHHGVMAPDAAIAKPALDGDIIDLSQQELMRIAVARGCRHYRTLLPADPQPVDVAAIAHETLGVALLRGSRDLATFQAIRCGAMVLSDLGNSPERIAEAAAHFGVAHRVAHIARLGVKFDQHAEYWRALWSALPTTTVTEDFLPGVSRFSLEVGISGPGLGPSRTWLRTHYRR